MDKFSGEQKAWMVCVFIIAVTVMFMTVNMTIRGIVFNREAIKSGYEQVAVPKTDGTDIVWRRCVGINEVLTKQPITAAAQNQ